jgi:hypothetical protein
MSMLKCEMCGGTLEIEDNGAFAVCAYCGTRQALPESGDSTPEGVTADALRIENEKRKTAEARAQAEKNRLKAEEQRLEAERMAEKNRIEKERKAQEKKGKLLKTLLILLVVIGLGALTITVIIPSIRYNNAVKDVEASNYEEAYVTFKSLYTFKDSQEQAKELIKAHPEVAQIGDIIYFGNYEQDNRTANGKEEIEWRVLEKDADGNMLVVSRYALDCRRYHDSVGQVTWENCDLRKWLNSEFYSTAFNKTQKKKIKATTIENRDNADYNTFGGNDTKDKVFLLSIDEAKTYLPSTVDRVCLATNYAESQGTQLEGVTKTCRWWLRSPGSTLYSASYVKIDGFILQLGTPVSIEKLSVRPAMWVKF